MDPEATDTRSTAPCNRCEMSIPADVDRCPVCGYRPAGYSPRLLRVGEALFALAVVASVLLLVAGVAEFAPGLPTDVVSRMAIVTPYTAGISGFFVYYIHGKRGTKPTESDAFGRG